jgi:Ras-related protein Rab-1A
MQKDQKEYSYKILLLGNTLVGKSCMLIKYSDDYFPENYIATVGIDYKLKHFELANGKKVKVQIWDTAGQDRYRNLTAMNIKEANIILLICDITNIESFNSLEYWYNQTKEYIDINEVLYAVIGNKNDLFESQIVLDENIEEFAQKINGYFYLSSSIDENAVHNLFKDIIEKFYYQFIKPNLNNQINIEKKRKMSIQISNQNKKKKKML